MGYQWREVLCATSGYIFKQMGMPSTSSFPAGWNVHMMVGVRAAILDHVRKPHVLLSEQ